MEPAAALADLIEISSQIEAAVLFREGGDVEASTLENASAAAELARAGDELLASAARLRSTDAEVTQLEAATDAGSVFVVRDGTTCIAATTAGNPTVGLVFYDLKSVLRGVKTEAKRPTRKRAAKTGTAKKTTAKKAPARKSTPRKKTDAS